MGDKEFDPDKPLEPQKHKDNGDKPFDDMVNQNVEGAARMADAAQIRLTDLVFNPDDEHLCEMTDIPNSQTEKMILARLQAKLPEILSSNGEMDIMEELLKIRDRVYRARGRKLVVDAHKFMAAEKENSKEVEDKLWG